MRIRKSNQRPIIVHKLDTCKTPQTRTYTAAYRNSPPNQFMKALGTVSRPQKRNVAHSFTLGARDSWTRLRSGRKADRRIPDHSQDSHSIGARILTLAGRGGRLRLRLRHSNCFARAAQASSLSSLPCDLFSLTPTAQLLDGGAAGRRWPLLAIIAFCPTFVRRLCP